MLLLHVCYFNMMRVWLKLSKISSYIPEETVAASCLGMLKVSNKLSHWNHFPWKYVYGYIIYKGTSVFTWQYMFRMINIHPQLQQVARAIAVIRIEFYFSCNLSRNDFGRCRVCYTVKCFVQLIAAHCCQNIARQVARTVAQCNSALSFFT